MLNLSKEGLMNIIKNSNNDLNSVIGAINIIKSAEETEEILELLEEVGIAARSCSKCDKIILQGYCIEGGFEYACSDECLYNLISKEEFEELISDNNSETYYTEWTELDENGHVYGGFKNAI